MKIAKEEKIQYVKDLNAGEIVSTLVGLYCRNNPFPNRGRDASTKRERDLTKIFVSGRLIKS